MKKVVIVADDYGLCESVNNGIMEAHQHGIVTELSLMLGSPGTDHALTIAKEKDVQNIGIHMLLKNWRDTGALVRREDYIKLFNNLSESGVAELVGAELREFEQIVGHKPTHITSQFGIVAHPKAIHSVIAYAKKHNIPMRQPVMTLYGDEPVQNEESLKLVQESQIQTTDYFFAHIMEPDYESLIRLYKNDLLAVGSNQTAEICLHPGFVSQELEQSTSLVHERERDTKLATDTDFRAWIDAHDIVIVSYREI